MLFSIVLINVIKAIYYTRVCTKPAFALLPPLANVKKLCEPKYISQGLIMHDIFISSVQRY